MESNLDTYDIVRVTRLLQPERWFDGTDTVARAPQVGDQGTIVHVHEKDVAYIVECVERTTGYTIWLADFYTEELELVEKEPQRRSLTVEMG